MGLSLTYELFFSFCFKIFSFSLAFDIITVMCLGVSLFGFILFRSLSFLDLDTCFVPQANGNFSYYFFRSVSVPFILSSPSGIHIMWIFVTWYCPISPSIYTHSFILIFSFLIWWVQLPCLWIYWSLSSALSSLLLKPFSVFFSLVTVFSCCYFHLALSFIFCFFVDVLTVFILLLCLVRIFMTIAMNSSSGKLLIFILLRLFSLKFYLVLLFRTYSSVSSFCLHLCACCYVSGRSADISQSWRSSLI